ncbi:MAG: hypothetical protein RIF33_10735 [Cyclobacteriaceae bacterium]
MRYHYYTASEIRGLVATRVANTRVNGAASQKRSKVWATRTKVNGLSTHAVIAEGLSAEDDNP